MGITSAVATFSSCYGEPFLVWHPLKYAQMLADKLEAEGASAWLLNTGWIGGAAHGRRCPLKYTRAMVDAVHSGELAQAGYKMCDHFNLSFPVACTGVPAEILDPAASWSDQVLPWRCRGLVMGHRDGAWCRDGQPKCPFLYGNVAHHTSSAMACTGWFDCHAS